MNLTPGTRINNYVITRILPAGGMGEVFLAEEVLLGRSVVIKRIHPQLTQDSGFRDRFIQEARIQARLLHPNIVALYNFFEDDGAYHMVLEYAEGVTLKELLETKGLIPEQRAIYLFNQILKGLEHAHSLAVVHRDIKPANIMVDANDRVKILDFGIAKIIGDKTMTQTGTKIGTLFYMSPEQVRAQKDIDHRTDIYSAGIVFYEMLSGKLPFDRNTDSDYEIQDQIVRNDVPDPRETYEFISPEVCDMVFNMTQKERESRCSIAMLLGQAPALPSDKPRFKPPLTPLRPSGLALKLKLELVDGGNLLREYAGIFRGKKYEIRVPSFFISANLVTQELWLQVMGANPSHFQGTNLPIDSVSWYDAIEFCNRLSLRDRLKPCYSLGDSTSPASWADDYHELKCDFEADGYRLPTEAEWEFAARGGTSSKGCQYSGSNNPDEVAWHRLNSNGVSHPVELKKPNELGLFDMSGNLWEWCWDWYDESYYIRCPLLDPRGPEEGFLKVCKGGSWSDPVLSARIDNRANDYLTERDPNTGFRVVRSEIIKQLSE